MNRRLTLALGTGLTLIMAACGPAAAPPSTAPATGRGQAPAAAPAPGGAPAAAPGEPKYGGTLVLGQRDAPENMNHYAGVFATQVVFGHFYEPLVRYDSNVDYRIDFPVLPALAESWTTPDDKTWVFKIRDGVKWHDGTPLTAEGVVWALEFLRDAKNNFPARSNLAAVDKITAEGNSVKFTTIRPTPAFIQNLTSVLVEPKHIFEAGGMDAMGTKSVGTGPFSLGSMDRNARTIFKKFPDYWGKDAKGNKLPYLDGFQQIHNMDQSTQQAALAAAQIDILNFPDKAQVDSFLKRVSNMQVRSYQFGSDVVLFVNQKAPWLEKKEVRQALHLILNRQDIIDNVGGGAGLLGLPAVSALKTGFSIPQEELAKRPGYRQPKTEDLAEAKRLLQQAGVPADWEIRFLNRATYNSAPQGEQAANQLKGFGLKIKYEPLDDATIVRQEREGNYDIYLELGANVDPAQAYNRYHSKGGSNFHKLADPEVDRITERLQATTDRAEQQKLSRQLQEIVLDNYYHLPLADPVIFNVRQPWVNGYPYSFGTQFTLGNGGPFLWFDTDKLPAARK